MQNSLSLEAVPVIITSCVFYMDVNKKSKCCKKYKRSGKSNCSRCPLL